MFNLKKVFITIEFADIAGVFDYPKYLPIPRKDDVIHFNGKFGKVEVVKHMTEGSVTEVRIECCRLNLSRGNKKEND
jgi:hypothetical protein